jgi:serine/threonine protein kinase/Tol biopolymer transport system component
MDPERWKQIEKLYHSVLNREPKGRAAFLKEACGGDEALRQEVESLLDHQQSAESFIEVPAMKVAAQGVSENRIQSCIGRQIGSYKVLSLLGVGGMGEVYLAKDLRLDRTIALKILPPALASDSDRLRRFIREARAASALKHPNVATIHEIGELEGLHFIAMEYVEGQTLASKISGRTVETAEIVEIGIQTADALDEAHSKGVTHRDIKPGNLMVTPRGHVKVLDFGLAKVTRLGEPTAASDVGTMVNTETGMVMGTVQYMSPEQVLGKEVDHRSDIFSLGVVLYEMATDRLPFSGANASEITDRILHAQPEAIARFNYNLPTELERIIRKCLEKDRERRYQSARELEIDLKNLKREIDMEADAITKRSARREEAVAETSTEAATPLSRRWRIWITWAAAALILTGLVIFWQTYPLPPPKILGSFQITNDGQQKVFSHAYGNTMVTDGSRLYFGDLRQVSITGGETVRIRTALQGVGIADISPSRTELLITSSSSATILEGPIWILPLPAGSPRRVGEVLAHDAAWSNDGQQITYAFGKELYLAKSDGTESHKLVSLPGIAFFLRWSPDGSRLRFTMQESGKTAYSLWEVGADGTHLHPLLPGWNKPAAECCGNWTADGKYFVFQSSRGGLPSIWVIREKGHLFRKPDAEPVRLTMGPMDLLSPIPSTDGKRLYMIGRQRRGELVRYDRNSAQLLPYLSGISATWLAFSSDRAWIAYVSYPEGVLWRSKADGTERQQLSFPPMRVQMPRWSPDGKQIAFIGIFAGKPWKIYLISTTGGNSQQLIPGERSEVDQDWSPDGNRLVFGRLIPQHLAEQEPLTLHLLDLRTQKLSTLPGSERLFTPRWSPDGRHIAAMSEDSQRMVVFDFTNGRWTELARASFIDYLSWSKDAKYIYFNSTSGVSDPALFRVSIRDRRIERLYSLKDTRQVYGDYGAWFGLDPEDSPLITRDLGTQEIYALDWVAP